MTVETTDRKQSFAGGQETLDFSFRALTASPEDIKVKAVLTATGVETDLTYTTDYTVSINSDGVGGTVTVSPSYSTSYTYTVYRETTKKQESDYDDYNQFPANTVENDLDRVTLMVQEVSEVQDRTIRLPISSTADGEMPEAEASTYLGWNSAATALENKTLPDPSTLVKTSKSNAEAGTNDTEYMTPLMSNYAITALQTAKATGAEAIAGTAAAKYMSPSLTTIAISAATTLIKYAESRIKIGSFTRDMEAISGDVAYTGIGFTPVSIMFFGGISGTDEISIGAGNVSSKGVLATDDGVSASTWLVSTSYAIFLREDGSANQTAIVKTLDSDGFTLTWAKAGTPTAGTATINYIAFR